MSFVSWAFGGLFLVVFAARLTFGRRKVESPYVAVLLVSSLVFYAWHVPAYLAILLFSALVDFGAGLSLGSMPVDRVGVRRLILAASLGTNLGLLAVFKYSGFVARILHDLTGHAGLLSLDGDLGLALPMGISFYTFQSMSYTIDVYRAALAPIRRFAPFLLFISFFPQLVAGPIVRASEFLPQLGRPRRMHRRALYEGAWLVISGYFLKMVCADNLAVYVDAHWDRAALPRASSAYALWIALMFSGQIFADFAGYSAIARGLAYLLGFRLPVNFDAPYLATSFRNFWERWHRTLSRWLRDYLYVPLGGNRRGTARAVVNLLLVMLLGGLWHGAAYTFIVWGGLHGAALAIERLLGLNRHDGWRGAWPIRAAWFAIVQLVVLIGWIVFRSSSLGQAGHIVGNVLAFDGWTIGTMETVGLLFLAPLVAMHVWAWLDAHRDVGRLRLALRPILAATMLYAIATLYAQTSAFIYFQF
jgi:alginate O-acetyltransferase complex protein AlgI